MEIKKAVKAGNKQATTVLAKQLVQMRKQKTRTYTAQSQIRQEILSFGYQHFAVNRFVIKT